LPAIGYECASRVAAEAQRTNGTIRQVVLEQGILSADQFDALVSPEAVCRLGSPDARASTDHGPAGNG